MRKEWWHHLNHNSFAVLFIEILNDNLHVIGREDGLVLLPDEFFKKLEPLIIL